jgi:hypothetical protein
MEIEFELPHGFVDSEAKLHKHGVMRLATAMDEIEPLSDPRVRNNEAYLIILLLSRVVIRLGNLPTVTPQIVEGLYASDLAYLQELYQRMNTPENLILGAVCPNCSTQFQLQVAPLGDGIW